MDWKYGLSTKHDLFFEILGTSKVVYQALLKHKCPDTWNCYREGNILVASKQLEINSIKVSIPTYELVDNMRLCHSLPPGYVQAVSVEVRVEGRLACRYLLDAVPEHMLATVVVFGNDKIDRRIWHNVLDYLNDFTSSLSK